MNEIWFFVAIGGFLPIIVWLMFWLRQDTNEPEPKRLIIKTFLFGIIAAFTAIVLQALVYSLNLNDLNQTISFAFIEEFAKFLAVFAVALGTVWVNEREDPILYMITGALGFAAAENSLFILNYLLENYYINIAFIDASYRFIGATLLHTVSSAIVGIFIAFVFYKRRLIKLSMVFIGLLFATAFHILFNLLVSYDDTLFQSIAFLMTWFGVIIILIFFQIIRFLPQRKITKTDIVGKLRKIFF